MRHHRHVVERDLYSVAGFRGDRDMVAPGLAVDRPDIGHHRPAQHQHRLRSRRAFGQGRDSAQSSLLRKVSAECRMFSVRQPNNLRH